MLYANLIAKLNFYSFAIKVHVCTCTCTSLHVHIHLYMYTNWRWQCWGDVLFLVAYQFIVGKHVSILYVCSYCLTLFVTPCLPIVHCRSFCRLCVYKLLVVLYMYYNQMLDIWTFFCWVQNSEPAATLFLEWSYIMHAMKFQGDISLYVSRKIN